ERVRDLLQGFFHLAHVVVHPELRQGGQFVDVVAEVQLLAAEHRAHQREYARDFAQRITDEQRGAGAAQHYRQAGQVDVKGGIGGRRGQGGRQRRQRDRGADEGGRVHVCWALRVSRCGNGPF